MDWLSWVLAIFLVILVALFFRFRRFRGCLEATGLPMVPPFLCFGSPPWLFNKIVYHEWYLEKHRELGRSFTRYEGVTPIICTIDPEFIKEVTVKQFENFTDVVDIEFSPGQTTLDVARYVINVNLCTVYYVLFSIYSHFITRQGYICIIWSIHVIDIRCFLEFMTYTLSHMFTQFCLFMM